MNVAKLNFQPRIKRQAMKYKSMRIGSWETWSENTEKVVNEEMAAFMIQQHDPGARIHLNLPVLARIYTVRGAITNDLPDCKLQGFQ